MKWTAAQQERFNFEDDHILSYDREGWPDYLLNGMDTPAAMQPVVIIDSADQYEQLNLPSCVFIRNSWPAQMDSYLNFGEELVDGARTSAKKRSYTEVELDEIL